MLDTHPRGQKITSKDDSQDTNEILKDVVESETAPRAPQRPHEQPWSATPKLMHADQLPVDEAARDLPFFKTSETARPDMSQWDRNPNDGVPTGLPSLLDLKESAADGIRPPRWPAHAPPLEEREDPVRGFQLFLAGGVIGGVFGSVMTYWFSVGF